MDEDRQAASVDSATLDDTLSNGRVRLSTVWKGLSLVGTALAILWSYDRTLVKDEDLAKAVEAINLRIQTEGQRLTQSIDSLDSRIGEVDKLERKHGLVLERIKQQLFGRGHEGMSVDSGSLLPGL